ATHPGTEPGRAPASRAFGRMSVGIVLYGAPATGKDTVTSALVAQDATFQLYERIKCGPGRTAGYRMVSLAEFQRLSLAGDFIWTNERYNARYAIDRAGLEQQLTDGSVPVVHAGQPEVIDAVRNTMRHVRWFVVQLVCSRD